MIFLFRNLLSVFVVLQVYGQYEGEKCFTQRNEGVCLSLDFCKSAQIDIRNRRQPQICSFVDTTPIVCCLDNLEKPPVATTPKVTHTTSTEYVPPVYDYKTNDGAGSGVQGCEALGPDRTAKPTGQKAWDKCIEYQQTLVFPCEPGLALVGDLGRTSKCHHNANDLIINGVNAGQAEFPHMALLGFGSDLKSVQWLCAGSVISERYILTAGHCTSASRIGSVTYAKVGILKRTDQVDGSKVYKIQSIIKYPEFNPPNRYHDIALLKTERDIQLNEQVVPACLDVGAPGLYSKALASGWGATENRGSSADHLQKVILNEFPTAECSKLFPVHRLMKRGFDSATQICYGDKVNTSDTCQGDSGGPLQINSRQINCMYTLIGVTSFGRACGYVGEPGIYTRVAHYVPWIEKIVWP